MLQIYAESLYWNHGLSQSRAARRVSRAGRVCSFEKPARSAQIEAWSRIQDRGSEFRTRDSRYSILIFTVLWKSESESELRIIGNFNTNWFWVPTIHKCFTEKVVVVLVLCIVWWILGSSYSLLFIVWGTSLHIWVLSTSTCIVPAALINQVQY